LAEKVPFVIEIVSKQHEGQFFFGHPV